MSGNAGYVAARRERARRQSNKLIEPSVTKSHHETGMGKNGHGATQPARPAGAGKHLCCVITCVDIEIAPMLGLAHKHVLVLRLAGPFVNAELSRWSSARSRSTACASCSCSATSVVIPCVCVRRVHKTPWIDA
jgi:hypothetical protein